MDYLAIKNWEKFQHYKDRNPPWIKLHQELLTSLTWALADNASRVLAISLMMLAAKTGNKIPADPEYIKRVAYLHELPDFSQLIKLEFIEIITDKRHRKQHASKPLAKARPETETETEERKKEPSARAASQESVFEKAYLQYPRHVGKRAAEKAWPSAFARASAKQAISNPDAEDFLYQRVMHYAEVCNRYHKDKQYIPHMATWLNQDRFMDDPSEWAVIGKSPPPDSAVSGFVSFQDRQTQAVLSRVFDEAK